MIKSTSCFRPYKINNKEIGRIIFYGNGQIHHTVELGWLEHCINDTETDIIELYFTPVRANKINLYRKDNYYLFSTGHYTLYIFIENPSSQTGDILHHQTDTTTCYRSYIRFAISGRLRSGELITEVNLIKSWNYLPTGFGTLLTTWAEQLELDDIKISTYDLQKLLTKYNLVPNG